MKIECPKDLNQFLIKEPMFENTFPEKDCEMKKFYGDCFHCFATSIVSRDNKIKEQKHSITNQEFIASLSPAEFWEKIKWLQNNYGKRYNDSYTAIIDWLKAESEERRNE